MSNKPILEWSSHPFFENPLKSILLVLFLGGFSIIFWRLTIIQWQMPIFYVLGMTYLLISLITYFIPTRYQLFNDSMFIYYGGIKIVKKYTDFGCFYYDKKSVTLGTFKRPRRLDTFRGTMLRFSKDKTEKAELLKFLRTKIEEYIA